MKRFQALLRIFMIVLVVFIAWTLRARAVSMLPIDFDEDDYLRAGQEYAHLIRTSDWAGFQETNYRTEHPPLAKIAYGIVFFYLPEQPLVDDVAITSAPARNLPKDLLRAGRNEAAVFGTLTAALLALVNPLGGLVLAVHTFTIKYTSQIMLDGLSALLSLGTILAYAQYKKNKQISWMVISAFLLGLAADSKYLHGTVGFSILVDYLLAHKEALTERKYKSLLPILGWGILSLVVFFAANPYLWPNPVGRLQESFSSVTYTVTNPNVESANFPIWQPFVWITMTPAFWHEGVFLVAGDFFIALFAILGFTRLWKKERVYALWLAFAMLTLLLWPTKWPQYILILTAPLSLSAGEGIRGFWQSIVTWWQARSTRAKIKYSPKESRQAIPWLTPGLIAFTLLTLLPFIFQIVVSLTDFNRASIRDGFQGGIWREFIGGITGQVPPIDPEFPFDSNKVQYTGFASFSPIFDYITGSGILVFNVIWAAAAITLQTILGLGLALLLNQKGVGFKKFWQAVFILPWAIPELIGALLWLNILVPDIGFLSLAAQKYGESFPLNFLIGWQDTPNLWLAVLLVPAAWYGFPLIMLASSAGLKMIPKDVFEAAAIDGANLWQTFRYITLPLLMPLLLPAIIIRAIFAFNQFYLFQAFQYSVFQATSLASFSYNLFNPSGFFGMNGQFSASAVVNIFTVIILAGLVALFNRETRSKEEWKNA